jgi:hypothetical protein
MQNAKEKLKTDYVSFIIEKSRKLPAKFKPNFPKDKPIPDIYKKWKETLNALIKIKLDFDAIDEKLDTLRAYYSGKKQVMSYLKFIEKATYDEDELSEKIKAMMLSARNALKGVSEEIEKYSKKDLKLLNLDLERLIVDLPEEE